MRLRTSLSAAAIALLISPSLASAQGVELGAYLRISQNCRTAIARYGERIICLTTRGALARLTTDTVYLSEPTAALSRGSIERLELRIRRNHRLRGAGIGALAGTTLGVAVGWVLATSEDCDGCQAWFLITVPAGLLFGTLTGVIVGGGEKWRLLPLDALGPSRSPLLPHGLKLGVALGF